MHPTTLTRIVAHEQSRDRIAAASAAIVRAPAVPAPPDPGPPIAIRRAGPADAAALERLALLEGRGRAFGRLAARWARDPELTVLVAESEGAPAAALVVASGAVLADPFAESAPLVRLLEARAGQLRRAGGARRRVRALAPRTLRV